MKINGNFGISDGIFSLWSSRSLHWYHHGHLNKRKSKKYSMRIYLDKRIERLNEYMTIWLQLPGPHRAILVAQHSSVLHIEHIRKSQPSRFMMTICLKTENISKHFSIKETIDFFVLVELPCTSCTACPDFSLQFHRDTFPSVGHLSCQHNAAHLDIVDSSYADELPVSIGNCWKSIAILIII